MWWSDALEPRLSQGDVVADALFFSVTGDAPSSLRKYTGSGGRLFWHDAEEEPDHAGMFAVRTKARRFDALVLSHSCELDKDMKRRLVSVVPLRLTSELGDRERRDVMDGRALARIPLPAVPGRGDCFADLRLIATMDRDQIDGLARLASMNQSGVEYLHARLVGFLTRRDLAAARTDEPLPQ